MTSDVLTPPVVLPTKRDEAWKYAPHRTLAELSFGPAAGPIPSLPEGLLDELPALDGPRVVIVNGTVDVARSHLDDLPAGVVVGSRAALGTEDATDLHEAAPADAFASFNAAYALDGATVDIAAGVVLSEPIHVVDVSIPDALGRTSSTRTRIRLGADSSARVVESRIGVGTELGGSNVVTSASLAEGATLDHVVVQDLPSSLVHLGRVEVTQAAGSTFRARALNLGATYGRLEYHVVLAGPEALADLAGVYLGAGDQVLDQQVTVVHAAESCVSHQVFRGVLDDESTGVFSGGIDVRPGADGTDASQSNDNLLLSRRAEINTQPRLEILADEVACTHGATVGRLDETALYYLQTRGIPVEAARSLLITSFANQVIDLVTIEPVRAWAHQRLGHGADA